MAVGGCSPLTPAPGAALCGVSAVGCLGSILAPMGTLLGSCSRPRRSGFYLTEAASPSLTCSGQGQGGGNHVTLATVACWGTTWGSWESPEEGLTLVCSSTEPFQRGCGCCARRCLSDAKKNCILNILILVFNIIIIYILVNTS